MDINKSIDEDTNKIILKKLRKMDKTLTEIAKTIIEINREYTTISIMLLVDTAIKNGNNLENLEE